MNSRLKSGDRVILLDGRIHNSENKLHNLFCWKSSYDQHLGTIKTIDSTNERIIYFSKREETVITVYVLTDFPSFVIPREWLRKVD